MTDGQLFDTGGPVRTGRRVKKQRPQRGGDCAACGAPFVQTGNGHPRRHCYDCVPRWGTVSRADYYLARDRVRATGTGGKRHGRTARSICQYCGTLLLRERGKQCARCRPDRMPRPPRPPRRAVTARPLPPRWLSIREVVLQRDDHRCRYCGAPAEHVDHITPRALGGTDDPMNLVAACAPCNYRRNGAMAARRLTIRGDGGGEGAIP